MPYNRQTDINDLITAKVCVADLLLAVNRLTRVYDTFIEDSVATRAKYNRESPKIIKFPSAPDSETRNTKKK
ncbi:MAG: hypothetical protein JXK07_03665 [Spirochaetes bacterium]|nr:hypothetical protein [Spirochaetota bacterium]MBN2770673.1 hypothetical protein [Spirochaetota bacterium]